eukprot:10801622-Lingulodinium_polyedra.AAC.1
MRTLSCSRADYRSSSIGTGNAWSHGAANVQTDRATCAQTIPIRDNSSRLMSCPSTTWQHPRELHTASRPPAYG